MSTTTPQTVPGAAGSPDPNPARPGEFVAINAIACRSGYEERFEQLFRSRAHAIDRAPGFRHMTVLRPDHEGGEYLVVSFWQDRAAFDAWRTSPEFEQGHRRGFDDVRAARERGEEPPMRSTMRTYEILAV